MNLVKCLFPASTQQIIYFAFYSVNVLHYTHWVSQVKPTFHSQDKLHLVMRCFTYCCIHVLVFHCFFVFFFFLYPYVHEEYWSITFHFLLNIFYWLCYYSCPIFPHYSPPPFPPHPPAFPHLSSCPWVVHISSLASTFPILFLTAPCYFLPTNYVSYSLYLFPHPPPRLPCW